jgi:hypothetical protein
MSPNVISAIPQLVSLLMLVGMLVLLETGRRIGIRRLKADPEGYRAGVGTVDGALFALLGLLLAFTFSGAATRFDYRRDLIVAESNAIGTAWLRLDLLPAERQPALRDLFRRYLDSRLKYFSLANDLPAANAELARGVALQNDIWREAVAAAAAGGTVPGYTLVLPAINDMIDIVSTRVMATLTHPPQVIFGLLIGLGLICAFLAGHGMAGGKSRSIAHMAGFAVTLAITVYVIMDLEYPRRGLIRVESADVMLIQLRASMD